MKKYILFLASFLFLNITYSQVLYDEDFDNFTLGNLGTDPDGIIPGQGGWLTKCQYVPASKDNSRFTITAEPGRGKVLTLSSFPTPQQYTMPFTATKTGLDTLIDQRTSGNNVIKLEFDFYMTQNKTSGSSSSPTTIWINSNGGSLVVWSIRKDNGNISVLISDGSNNSYVVSNKSLPFDTWVTFIAYLDYNNKKSYFETSYFGTVAVSDFLDQSNSSNSSNLMQDFKPSEIHLGYAGIAGETTQMFNKYDNIKITALNAVPPHILSVTNVLAEQFNLYPNPATDRVNITNNENYLVNQVVIYDVTGKQLSTQTFNNESEIQLNIENLASGVYMLHIETNEGTAVKKLVKK